MGADLGGNNEEEAKQLVLKAPLPPSLVESKFLKVEKNHFVYHADVPAILNTLDAPKWKDTLYLKRTFKPPLTGCQQNSWHTQYHFPCFLLEFGPAALSLSKRLIVINWWLNLTREQQEATWERLKLYFLHPTVLAEQINQCNPPNDPKVKGILEKGAQYEPVLTLMVKVKKPHLPNQEGQPLYMQQRGNCGHGPIWNQNIHILAIRCFGLKLWGWSHSYTNKHP
jgi:hypothetical protein